MIEIDNKYIGIPFEILDCWQLICQYFKNELGISLPTHETEYRDAYDQKNISYLYERDMAEKTWRKVVKPEFPDIAIFRINGYLWHAGIVLGNNKMLHTQQRCNSVIERYDKARWEKRLYGFYRYQNE